ncbi:hypothetical protein E2C01_037609 [Portunus trituberculatus]|uniref:Uncharacterized protein n=1 Tax=Portunus trituberculatus TaxID=210409 RepID=A0A5B7F9T2_PORTR|nr:hypothetical protein [Portunus trituberculatus]
MNKKSNKQRLVEVLYLNKRVITEQYDGRKITARKETGNILWLGNSNLNCLSCLEKYLWKSIM